ncbi:MAG TPA: flavodoxin-dependent (E)-4-hydroxy-3-methylbut-2-enyl-diphosphate synthase [Bacilli bacterium]|nr:MAG: 4-hydroxy-3-methylbut-2-en-1-yl diphosphate synthase [Tenericutes bacterium ADurb.BinA124]HPX84878.1 flavodoxin-dependent (E)-4-hydroxy-3-methylbut-2-enyl-diphosphate synthase [Bacilli bacterium]
MERKKTLPIQIGKITIGNKQPIAIQSMTNTKTKDVTATVKQILALEQIGCEIIRVAVLDMDDALALKTIKNQIHLPLVADIHFDYRLALASIEAGVDKLRINPGNIGSVDRIKMVVDACKRQQIPIRIGINAGSLEKDILKKHQHPTADAMIESAQRHVDILESFDFHNIVLSLKASDVVKTVEAYQMASHLFPYPLHLGITEAGTQFSGTVKSAIGLGILLNQGIGDTLRVSLSSDPINEVKVAKEILSSFGLYQKPILISCPSCGRIQYDMFPIINEIEAFLDQLGKVDITVAIMGCAVNGPGEAMEADIGIAGGANSALLIKKGKILGRIDQSQIISTLKQEIIQTIELKKQG